VDKHFKRDPAKSFVPKKNEKHIEGVWVLLFCDNLGAFPEAM